MGSFVDYELVATHFAQLLKAIHLFFGDQLISFRFDEENRLAECGYQTM